MRDKEQSGLQLTKRGFLRLCGAGVSLIPAVSLTGFPVAGRAQTSGKGFVRTRSAAFVTPLDKGEIQCGLCPRRCRVQNNRRGYCRVRENRGGQFYSLVYGNPCAAHLDPIEKKPFFHVLPGTTTFSLATAGCNFHCKFCQNWEISQVPPEDLYNHDLPPAVAVRKAMDIRARSVAYTYVEPVVFYEYMLDTGHLAKKEGLLNVFHSNGFINPEPLRDLCRILAAANIDLKGFSEGFYKKLVDGTLDPVLESLKILKRAKVHLEITNLVIPTENDDIPAIRAMCLWIKQELGADTPVHFTRFYPLYRLQSLPPTPVSTLEKARSAAQSAGLEYVYIGNVPGHAGENTVCPACRKMIIRRIGFMVGEMHMKQGKCGHCGKPIPGIWA
jgi:pyruvate formate lyase activating enzyme